MSENLLTDELNARRLLVPQTFNEFVDHPFVIPDGPPKTLYMTALGAIIEGSRTPNETGNVYTRSVFWSPGTTAEVTTDSQESLSTIELSNPLVGKLKIEYQEEDVIDKKGRAISKKAYLAILTSSITGEITEAVFEVSTNEQDTKKDTLSMADVQKNYSEKLSNFFARIEQAKIPSDEEVYSN